jgi:alpha-glucosidase (family GH31 glycosyl hydrolase)
MFNHTSSNNLERIILRRLTTYLPPFYNSIDTLALEVDYLNSKTLRLKIYDATKARYEVPLELNNVRNTGAFVSDFIFEYENRASDNVFQFRIKRRSNGKVLFDTSIGGFVFEDQFLQIATILPTGSDVYGFGQNNHPSLSHNLNYKTWGMFARDEPNVAGEELNQYGVHPVYNVLENDGNAHGVVLVNSNALEHSFMPYPAMVLRSIGGIFDFYFFSGPTPETVVQQYTALVGHPVMIPYFALGFQLSRWDYQDLNDMKKIVKRNLDAGIPLDIQYADIEHMRDQMDFTLHPQKFIDLPDYFRELQAGGMHVVPIVDPALLVTESTYKPYTNGFAKNVYIKWPQGLSPSGDYAVTNSDVMLGYCWPLDKVAYPDFMYNTTEQWWIDELVEFRKTLNYDAIWIGKLFFLLQ